MGEFPTGRAEVTLPVGGMSQGPLRTTALGHRSTVRNRWLGVSGLACPLGNLFAQASLFETDLGFFDFGRQASRL